MGLGKGDQGNTEAATLGVIGQWRTVMKKIFPSLTRQLEILGMQVLLGCCAQPTLHAGQPYIPGYYGNASSILPPAATALPTGASVISGISEIETSGKTMTVHQDKSRAVIHWGSFDVGSDASVRFDQPDTSSKVLNRVTGNSPSQIYGSLTANGQVYILNQNGILFGQGSQINVHSLTASALNIKFDKDLSQYANIGEYDKQFTTLSSFYDGGTETYQLDTRIPYTSNAAVANHGSITAGNLGTAFLIGPQVENNGSITAEGGDVGLLAGDQVSIYQNSTSVDFNITATSSRSDTAGTATNYAAGAIVTDKGFTGMYGKVVNQEGLIRATTALEKNGRIKLVGSDKVRTGAASITEAPVSNSGERKIVDASAFDKSDITITSSDGSFEHYGQIIAPGGNVTISAKERIYLESGSSIDVSGTWVALTAGDRTVVVQLNSEELRDAFAYKNGPLKGEKILVDIVTGLDIADISGYLESTAKSAAELTTQGGSIYFRTTGENGEVIVKQGATLDFSGGGLIYGDGLIASSKVRIGNKLYDLQDIPAGVPIDEVLGSYSVKHDRYGLTDSWSGLYYGGSSPYLSYLSSFVQGSDAGSLSLIARKIVLDGTMNASVVRGIYQTLEDEDLDENGNLKTIGRRVPRAGTLQIGEAPSLDTSIQSDLSVDAIVVQSEVAPTAVTVEGPLQDNGESIRTSEISAAILNNAGLGTLKLYANNSITIDQTVDLTLAELGSAVLASKFIENQGSIRIPSGTVDMTLRKTLSSSLDQNERIFLATGSAIDVSGLRLDNSTASSSGDVQFGFTHGGTVTLFDNNDSENGEIVLAEGSSISVNGGYIINSDHSFDGANAGSISLTGSTVQPGGTLTGLALEGYEGGSLSIHTNELTLTSSFTSTLPYGFTADDALPSSLQHQLSLASDRFADSGFTHLTFMSEGDLLVENGVNLTPSGTRLAEPVWTTHGYRLDSLDTALPEYFGSNSITLAAGQTVYTDRAGSVTIEEGAHLTALPAEGAIAVTGDNVTLGGTLTALGGEISVEALNGDVTLSSSARLDASGTLLPDWDNSLFRLGLNYTVIDGGTVSLAGYNLVLDAGSTVDVSGSGAVTNKTINQRGRIVETTIASAAGSVSLNYGGTFTGDGQLAGASLFDWLPGGSLTIAKTTNSKLTINEEQVSKWLGSGFDDLTFSSRREIDFLESVQDNDNIVTIATGRALTLNSSALIGSSNQDIRLSAPWVRLTNIVEDTDADLKQQRTFGAIAQGTARLSLNGEFIDIQGNVALSGFDQAGLYASQDLRLYDYYYSKPQKGWSGALRTAGDLELRAAAIYPATHHTANDLDNTHVVYPTSFTISAGLNDSQGKIATGMGRTITILPSSVNSNQTLYSAGGRLALQAGAIELYGTLAAPMGTLSLTAENGIHLYPGSLLTTRGQGMTLYGKLEDEQWTVGGYLDEDAATNGLATLINIDAAPDKSITLTGKEITQPEGATIDAGGGGSIFAYQFLPGFDGSSNPLGASNRYVILPDNSVILPGKTVYLEGTSGLPAGTYSLLPAEYAFLPGALVIEATGDAMLPGETQTTALGYTVVAGYESDRSTSATSPLRTGYIIRSASDVMTEGNFDTAQFVAGDAGSIIVNAGTGSSVLSGSILGDALAGYNGGSLTLGAEDLFIGNIASLTADTIDDYNLVFDVDKLRNRGLRQLTLGGSTTKAITIGSGSSLQDVAQVDLDADERITLERGAQILAMGNDSQAGALSLTTDALYGATGSMLHASDALTLSVNTFSADTFAGSFQVDHGTFQLNSHNIYLEPTAYAGARGNSGTYLSSGMIGTFKAIDTVVLNSTANITFLGDVNLTAKKDLVLDGARIAVAASAPAVVNIAAGGELQIANDGSATSQNEAASGSSLHLNAERILFEGANEVFLDTFSDVRFASRDETIFKGTGTLKTDLAAGENLSFSASRYIAEITQSTAPNADGSASLSLSSSDYTIDAGTGDVAMTGNGLSGTGIMAMPGALTVKGTNISLQDATFDLPGGEITFEASGDISAVHSALLARGGVLNFPITIGDTVYNNSFSIQGGQIIMESANGQVYIDETSTLDTSAALGLDGGRIDLIATQRGVVLDGTVRGDELYLDTNAIADFGSLAATIGKGGFRQQVGLRARTGNVIIGQNDTIATSQFVLTADQGTIDIAGAIDASGEDGGSVEISANNTLILRSGSRILASASDNEGKGGDVSLASATGGVETETGSLIDVSGSTSDTGGSISFRALRDVIESGGMRLHGTIQGASKAIARAFRVYPDPVSSGNTVVSSISSYLANITSNWTALTTAWNTAGNSAAITLVPEIEVRSNGNMTISGGLTNLASLSVPNGIPGVLTFRAAGNLNVTSNIIDAPQSSLIFNELTGSDVYAPLAGNVRDSWDLNFIAGADMTSARLLAVRDGIGNFTVGAAGNGKVVYTESGDIIFASGEDTTIYRDTSSILTYMPGTSSYNLASFDGSIRGFIGDDLILNGGIIQTAVSDIALQVGGDVTLSYLRNGIRSYGAIRTIGRAPTVEEIPVFSLLLDDPDFSTLLQGSALERFWEYRDGGNITLTVAGDISGDIVKSANGTGWGYAYSDYLAAYALGQEQVQAFGADYGVTDSWGASTSNQAAHGIVTMAGGDISIKGDAIKAQIGVFGEGNLDVYARDNLDGRFLATDGDIHLTSLTNFGNTTDAIDTLVELGSGSLLVQALGNTSLGTVVNPTLTTLRDSWLLSYSQDSSVTLLSALGDVILSGEYSFVNDDSNFRYHLLPGTLGISAARDIRINSLDDMYLAPSADSQFSLVAGRDINGKATSASITANYQNSSFYISAADPDSIYGQQTMELSDSQVVKMLRYGNVSPQPLHFNNITPALLTAGQDIANLTVAIPKQAEITAQRDIRELNYWGQNLHETDVSLISAGRDVIQQPYKGKNDDSLGIWQAGKGFLLVRAGNSIDLGSTSGIQSTGNIIGPDSTTNINTALFDESDKDEYGLYKGADLAVLSGYSLDVSNTELADFFAALARYGKQFSELMSTGDEDDANEAARLKTTMLEEVINPLLAGKQSGSGDIKMTQSVIKTTSGQDDLYILAGGQIDVGTTIAVDFNALKAAGETEEIKRLLSLGILTQGGGDINVFAENDINVNESRVVTSFGGDIFMLSNHGDINAGRGSTTTITYPEEKTTQVGGKRVDKNVPPVPGSGIRTDTADADGSGPLGEPPQGTATLIAWEGVIDAGEAGIAASNVTLAATKILNSENISFSDAGVGVPTTADSGPSIGALAGSTTVTDTQTATQSIGQQMAESSKQLAESVNKMAESLNIKMMIFKFEGFGNE